MGDDTTSSLAGDDPNPSGAVRSSRFGPDSMWRVVLPVLIPLLVVPVTLGISEAFEDQPKMGCFAYYEAVMTASDRGLDVTLARFEDRELEGRCGDADEIRRDYLDGGPTPQRGPAKP